MSDLEAKRNRPVDRSMQTGLAEAYIPFQIYSEIYPPEEGLVKGTIFPELDRPYLGRTRLSLRFSMIYKRDEEE